MMIEIRLQIYHHNQQIPLPILLKLLVHKDIFLLLLQENYDAFFCSNCGVNKSRVCAISIPPSLDRS